MAEPTKRCPFCGEEILAVAIKCKHCGSMLGGSAPDEPLMTAELPSVKRGWGREASTKTDARRSWIFPARWGPVAKVLGTLFMLWFAYATLKTILITTHPAGSDVPACDSADARETLQKAFNESQFARILKLSAVDVNAAKETGFDSTTHNRYCAAEIAMNNTSRIPVTYKMERRGEGGYLLEFHVAGNPDSENSAQSFPAAPSKPQPTPTPSLGSVHAEHGNIYYDPPDGQPSRLLVASGTDSEPTLSPDGHLVAFVRTVAGKQIATGRDEDPATDLWLVTIEGTEPRRVLEARGSDDMEHVLAGIQTLRFSPDGRKLYFLSAAWATSDAVHVLDLQSGLEQFVAAGNSLSVIQAGRYAGDLIIRQHRYHKEGGSYDWVWLFSPEGKEIQLIGDPDSPGFEARLAGVKGLTKRVDNPAQPAVTAAAQTTASTVATTNIPPETIRAFAEAWLQAGNTAKSPDDILSYYASEVDYYKKGLVPRTYIEKDKAYFIRRWPHRRYQIQGDIRIENPLTSEPAAVFSFDYQVSNDTETKSGTGAVKLTLREENGRVTIVGEKVP